MQDEQGKPPLDPYRDVIGIDLPPDRLEEILCAYTDILSALRELRSLDLTDVHPAIVFDPTLGYDSEALS